MEKESSIALVPSDWPVFGLPPPGLDSPVVARLGPASPDRDNCNDSRISSGFVAPCNGLSLKTRERSSLALKHIFDRISKEGPRSGSIVTENSTVNEYSPSWSWFNQGIIPLHYANHQSLPALMPATVPTKQVSSQLTIFYSGMVNVYDSVPADKAQAIMILAGSGQECSLGLTKSEASPQPSIVPANPVVTTTSKPSQVSVVPSTPIPTVDGSSNIELPHARKASLARFLERRKDRVQAKPTVVDEKLPCEEDKNINTYNKKDLSHVEKKPTLKRALSRSSSPSPSSSKSRCSSPSLVCVEEQ